MSEPYWPDNWPVTLQFVDSGHPHDRLIQYFSHGWPSHVDVAWPPSIPGGPERLFGARMQGGVTIMAGDASYVVNAKKIARVTLPLTTEQEEKFFAFCREQMGKPYDFTAIMNFVDGRDWRSPNHWFCSELMESATEHSEFWLPIASPSQVVTPTDYFNLCSSRAEVAYVR